MWITAARRVTFVLALLTSGALGVSCFHLAFNSSLARTATGNPPAALVAFGTFAWGADAAMEMVLALWLAGRSNVWRTWSGWLRAAAYLLAFSYGRMLFSVTQYWLAARQPAGDVPVAAFRWPGADLQDYARPAIDLLTLLMLVWILLPVFTITRSALAEEKLPPQTRGTFSIASILGWTTAAALILVWIRFLTWKGVAPETAFSFQTPTEALQEFLVEFGPSLLIFAVAAFLVVWGWSGRWWFPLAALAGALVIDSFGHRGLFAALKWITGNANNGNVLAGPALEHWSFIAGRTCLLWTAFGLARLMGVRLYR